MEKEKKGMRKKEKKPYFVGDVASKSIEIDWNKSKGNISWNDGEVRPLLTTSSLGTQINKIEIDYREPLWA